MSKAKKRTNPVETVLSSEEPVEMQLKKTKNDGVSSVSVEFKSVEDALKSVKKVLHGTPSQNELSFDQMQKWCVDRNISIPWPADLSPSKDFIKSEVSKELSFDFEAPKSVAIAGSFMLQTSLSDEGANVDLIVEQPEGLIFRYSEGAKDHINWRYWLRRMFYLTVCFDSLKRAFPSSDISFDKLHGNPFKSVILIKFTGIDRVVRVIPSIPFSEAFQSKILRLSPQRSNVRPSWIQLWIEGGSLNHELNVKELPTPFYNYSLLSEALYLPHLLHLHESLKGTSGGVLTSSIKMLKAWLKQTGNSGVTSINGFLASMWLVDLLNCGVINPSIMDELQIFKLVLRSWIDLDTESGFCKKLSNFEGFFPDSESEMKSTLPSLLAGPMNLFYGLNFNSLQRVSQSAQSTLSFLSNHPDRLDRIFLSKVNFDLFTQDLLVEYDGIYYESALKKLLPAGVLQNYGNVVSSGYLEGRIALVLKKGLTDRIREPMQIKIIQKETNIFNIRIGITLDTLNCGRITDLGPNSEDMEAAAKFRGFWGSKSELRQFKDSAIRECVYWSSGNNSAGSAAGICKDIISWLMTRHFGIGNTDCRDTSTQLNFFTSSPGKFGSFSATFDSLTRELRGLNQILPLSIVHCIGLSAGHRHTSLDVPEARLGGLTQEFPSSLLPSPPCAVYDFLIRFERSSAWPDERQALQTARQAFLLQLNRTLNSRKIVQASLVASEYIDIFYNGFIFRGWLEVPREELRCRVEGLNLEAERIERRNFWQTRLSSALHQLASRHGAYPETCRLVKQFFAGRFICLDDDLVDSLVALVFLTDEDQKGSGKASWIGALLQNCPAGTALTGFLRFLDLLINFPWNERPLILDFSSLEEGDNNISGMEIDAMKQSDWSVLLRTNNNNSSTDAISLIPIFSREQKAMILNSLASSDLSSLIPTLPLDSFDRISLIRCKLLARLTLEQLESDTLNSSITPLESFFRMSLEAICGDFDVLIKLDPNQIQGTTEHHIEGLTRILRNAPQANSLLFSLLPGFSAPERLVKELSGPFKSLGASIAYNPTNPVMLAVRVKDPENKIESVVETIKRIGGDLISDIKITRK